MLISQPDRDIFLCRAVFTFNIYNMLINRSADSDKIEKNIITEWNNFYMRKYIEAGKITRPHGINGTVKVESWCDSPSVLASLKSIYTEKNGEYNAIAVLSGAVQKDHVLLKLRNINTPEAAERLRGTVIFADRNDIPVKEGAYLIDDLKGLSVTDITSGRIYGTLSDVIQGAAGDIYEISTESGIVMIPAVKEFIKSIDLESGIVIAPISGMFDEN